MTKHTPSRMGILVESSTDAIAVMASRATALNCLMDSLPTGIVAIKELETGSVFRTRGVCSRGRLSLT